MVSTKFEFWKGGRCRGLRAIAAALLLVGAAGPAAGQAVAALSMRAVDRDGPAPTPALRSAAADPPPDGRHPGFRNPLSEHDDLAVDLPRDPASFWQGWRGSVEAGVNGSTGNSENFTLRMGFSAERHTQPMDTLVRGSYAWSTDGGEKTKSRGEFDARNDWTLGESRWFLFALGKVEYDEFQDWRWRLSGIVGPGYAVIRDRRTTLKLRVGFGASRELGGTRNEILPELNFGADVEHQLTDRQRVFATHDTYPSAEDFADLRSVTRAGWEIVVDPQANLFLKLGVEHRHQSEPGDGFKKNDMDYFALVGWQF